MIDPAQKVQWQALSLEAIDGLAQAWEVVDFFAQAPSHLQGSLLLALTRSESLLVALSDGRKMLLIRYCDAAAVWQSDSNEHCMAVQRVRQDNAWLMAFMPRGSGSCLSSLPPGPLALVAASSGHVDVLVGSHMRITIVAASRSWDWAWSPTLGPVYLTLYLERSADQIKQWLLQNLPQGYAFVGDRLHATRNPQPEKRLRHTDEVWFSEGRICFVHGYYRHVEPVDNARATFLLRKLARAELGELSFDLFDGDYGRLCAAGYGCDSLSRYLDPEPRHDHRSPHPWNTLRQLEITVPAAIDVTEHIRQSLNLAVGLPAQAPLGAALAMPIQQLPRWITVRLPLGVRDFDHGCHDPDHRIGNRIRWFTA